MQPELGVRSVGLLHNVADVRDLLVHSIQVALLRGVVEFCGGKVGPSDTPFFFHSFSYPLFLWGE